MSCAVGPGWFGDVFDVAVSWETDMLREAPKPLEDDEDEDRVTGEDEGMGDADSGSQVLTIPVFTGDGPIKGVVTIAPISRSGVWHGGITVSMECMLTRFRVMESAPIVRITKKIAESATVTEELTIPFAVEFSPNSVPETFDGDSISIRCMASVVVERPWWTFDVARSFQFATQNVQPKVGDEWMATENKFREELTTLIEARNEKSKALEEAAAAGKDPDPETQALVGPILGLSVAEADEVPWWLVVSDGGCRAIFDFSSSVVNCEQVLAGSLVFQDVRAPIVRVRVRLIRIEAVGDGAQDTVLFDGDAMDALTQQGRKSCEAVEAFKMNSMRETTDSVGDADLSASLADLSAGLTVEEARRGMRTASAKQAERHAAATSPRSASGGAGGLGAAAAAGSDVGAAAAKGDDADALSATRAAEDAAALLPGAGTLWDPSRAVVMDSTLEASLDLSMLDVLPSAFGEAEDPDAEPEDAADADTGADADAASGAGAAVGTAEGVKSHVTPSIDFSVRTILQVWVYTVNPKLPGDSAKRPGEADDSDDEDGEDEADLPWMPIVPAWNSREILTFRSRPLTNTPGPGETEATGVEAVQEDAAGVGYGKMDGGHVADGAASYKPYGSAAVVPEDKVGRASIEEEEEAAAADDTAVGVDFDADDNDDDDASATGVDLGNEPAEVVPRSASVGSISSTHSRRGISIDPALGVATTDGDSVHVGITPTSASRDGLTGSPQRARPSLQAPPKSFGDRTVSSATADDGASV